jgi:hypothetical protein
MPSSASPLQTHGWHVEHFMSLRGKKVAILESRLGRQLVELVEGAAGSRFTRRRSPSCPTSIRTRLPRWCARWKATGEARRLPDRRGTRALFAATDSLGFNKLMELLAQAVVAVRGPKPTAALRARGVRIDRAAADPFTTTEVLASLKDLSLRGERVIVQRHGAANLELDRALEARGAAVVEIPTYRWACRRTRRRSRR